MKTKIKISRTKRSKVKISTKKSKVKISRSKKSKVKISRTIIKKSRRFRQMSKTLWIKKPTTRPTTQLRRDQRSKPKVKNSGSYRRRVRVKCLKCPIVKCLKCTRCLKWL